MAAIGFPPEPVFPNAIDSDRTLYLVHNTTESLLAEDNEPWCTEISIIPVGASDSEIWANNGFGNIDGELFYYDDVRLDENGKVNSLIKCARNLGGVQTHFVKSGGKNCQVRGYVVAEHHNQLVKAVCQVEKFVGYNFDPDPETLDYRIRCLRGVPICQDDFNCPTVTFRTQVVESDPCDGILLDYFVDVQGNFNSLTINFGDGTTTNSIVSGQHRYAPGTFVDPVVTVSSESCQVCVTPSEREGDETLCAIEPVEPFTVPIPDVEFPQISFTIPEIPQPQIELAPLLIPCVELSIPNFPSTNISIVIPSTAVPQISIPSIFVDIPSEISIVPSEIVFGEFPDFPTQITFGDAPNFPTLIEFGPVDIPSTINVIHDIPTIISASADVDVLITVGGLPSEISLVGDIDIPSVVSVVGNVDLPSEISIICCDISETIQISCCSIPDIQFDTDGITFPVISFDTSAISISANVSFAYEDIVFPDVEFGTPPDLTIDWGTPPSVDINWGTPPACSCVVAIECPSSISAANAGMATFAARDSGFNEWESPEKESNLAWGIDDGITMEMDINNLGIPSEIKVLAPERMPDIKVSHNLPEIITVKSADIPSVIKLEHDLPKNIRLVDNLPKSINVKLEAPEAIKIDSSGLPAAIPLTLSKDFPSTFKLEAVGIPEQIQVVGLPDTIQLVHDLPEKIELEIPDNAFSLQMPENPKVQMVYEGAPIELKVDLNVDTALGGEDGESPCVMIVPCKK